MHRLADEGPAAAKAAKIGRPSHRHPSPQPLQSGSMIYHPRRWRRLLTILGGVTLAVVATLAISYRAHARHALPVSMAGVAGTNAQSALASSRAASAAPDAFTQRIAVPARSNFAAACAPFHLGAELLQHLVAVAKPVFNLGHIQAGNTLTLVRDAGGALQALSYQIDANHRLWLRVQAVQAAGATAVAPPPQWSASIETIAYETRLAAVSGTVQSSLFQAVEDAGEHDPLALDFAGIFGWDLDFYTDPQPGDVFRVVVEKQYLDGKFSHYGQIVAAEYVNAGEKYDAVRFHDADGELAYYRPNGQPLKREFLRSPLKFVALHVTSGFTRSRYHPILKVYRAHLGVDYGAPLGTPVQSIGSGVVIHAGRKGEDGNMVQIRHAQGYETYYLHLSRILVRAGEHVAQGERIGLVGMTGLATGPHLDFRVEHNGQFEDFQRLRKTLPPAEPVSAKLMPEFRQLTARYMPELAGLQPAAAPAQAAAITAPAP